MTQSKTRTTRLIDFYQRMVLPELFNRLDRAFPELAWRKTSLGWTGRHRSTSITCHQPWGFQTSDGASTSWLVYANQGRYPDGAALVKTIRKLADLAQVSTRSIDRRVSADEQREAVGCERQRELIEAFIAFCQASLHADLSQPAWRWLHREYGFDPREVSQLPLGIYPTAEAIEEYLLGVGFTEREISASCVARDSRLPGRVMIPWRDRYGRIETILAQSFDAQTPAGQRRIYLRRRRKGSLFGLDLALRPNSGGHEHLVIVEGPLEAIYLQSQGFTNVAACRGDELAESSIWWKEIAGQGVRTVTLALRDRPAGWDRTEAALRAAARASQSPRIYATEAGALGECSRASTFCRLHGVGQFRQKLQQRQHGWRFVAEAILRRHRSADHWTDTGLVATIGEGVAFDKATYAPVRMHELDRFFWKPILQATGASWEAILQMLTHRTKHEIPVELPQQPVEIPAPPPAPVQSRAPRPVKRKRKQKPAPPLEQPAPKRRVNLSTSDRPRVIVQPRTTYVMPRATRRPERKPVAPVTVAPVTIAPKARIVTDDDIRRTAYLLWERLGCPEGMHETCWREAKEMLLKGAKLASAANGVANANRASKTNGTSSESSNGSNGSNGSANGDLVTNGGYLPL